MRLTIIEPADSCREMRGSIEALLSGMRLDARMVPCPGDRQGLAKAIATALDAPGLVLVIGGLSHGGYAFEAAADALGRPLIESNAAAKYIERRCREQDLVFSEFERCCRVPQGAKAFAGDGVFPACLCVQDDRMLLLFDEYDDPALLFRLKMLLASLCQVSGAEYAARAVAEPPQDSAPPGRSPNKRPPRPARRRRSKRAAVYAAAGCVVAALALTGAIAALLGAAGNDRPAQQAALSDAPSKLQAVLGPVRESPSWRLRPSSKPAASSEPASSSASTAPVSSEPPPAQASSSSEPAPPPASSEPAPPPASSEPAPPPASSEVSTAPESSAPSEASSSAPEDEEEWIYIYDGEDDEDEDEEDQQEKTPPRGSDSMPDAHADAFDETLSYSVGGSVRRMNAYDLVCQVMENETRGNLASEALKAHVVATYTMIKYHNAAGTAPEVLLNSNVSTAVKNAVDAVLGVAVHYNDRYANTVYHSTSCGATTSSQAVWGGALPYLVSVTSDYDSQSPYYRSSYVISEDDFADKVRRVYGITLDGDPEDWISVYHDAPGGYVGTVEIGGETRSQGGSYGTGAITGRSVRERLLAFALRSHCFDVEYNASRQRFEFTVYGYGHGVGMSQYGAHFMALDGYDYVEILEHYYTGTEIY